MIGNPNVMVSDVAPVESAQPHHLSFITDEKYIPFLQTTKAGVVLVTKSLINEDKLSIINCQLSIILVDNARGAMGQLLQIVSKAMNPAKRGIEQPCFVSEGVEIPEDAYIGAFAYIGTNVSLGKGVQIYPNT